MANVTIDVDAEESAEGEPGDAADTESLSLDVCREDQFIWFDPGELDELPEDLPDPEPSTAELEKVAQIRKAYDRDIDESLVDDSMLGRFADRVATRHPGFLKFLDRVVYRGALDQSDAA